MRVVIFFFSAVSLASAQVKVDFARDIKPIFDRSCVNCHGPDRPKSGFRLDNRDAAMKGGDNDKAILPSDSTNSPLIQVVMGVHPDIQKMPPKGKGEPLTAEEIALLRAWIDQGAEWPDATTAPQTVTSATLAMRWISVRGDERKFRQHFWMEEGFHAGLQDFLIQERPSPNSSIKVEGRIFPEDEDFRIALRYDQWNVGFINVGFAQYQKYFDDSGGFYPFPTPVYTLDRDLELRVGRAWLDFGLTLPNQPKLALGYEYQFRQGTQSTLQWGPVTHTSLPVLPEVSTQKNIFPAFKEVDEALHILKFDASHEIDGLYIEDNFRAEFYDLSTQRQNALSVTEGNSRPSLSETIDEAHDEFRAVNALRFEKEIREWWFISGGYLYSKTDADASFRQNTEHATGLPVAGNFWRSHAIILSQDSLLLNANARLGPWQHLTFSAGVQSEWMQQDGVGRVNLDSINPALTPTLRPATLDADLHRHNLQENVSLRFTGLPYTSLFAEARLEQERVGAFEQQVGGDHPFLRDTDVDGDANDWRVGFYSSPLSTVSLGGHYRQRNKDTDYDHIRDDTVSYPAFIQDRQINTHEFEAKLTWRPLNWLKSTLTYQLVDTDFDSATPGGALRAGTFNANVYSANLILTPFTRWHFSGTFHYYDSRSASAHNNVPSIAPYRGDIYGALATATYMLSTNTDLMASYSFSRADYGQHNYAGLPLGIDYDWHVLQAGISRRFRRVAANLQYALYEYAEPSSRGFNDYTAHGVFATLTFRWP